MLPAPVASGGHVELAGIGLCVGDQLRNRLDRDRKVHIQNERLTIDSGDWCDVAQEIEIKSFVDRCIDRVRRIDHEQRMAVWRRFRDRLSGDVVGSARAVLNDEWLAKSLRQPLPDQSHGYVTPATCGKANDDADRT